MIEFPQGVTANDIQKELNVDPSVAEKLLKGFQKMSLKCDEHTLDYQYLLHFGSHLCHKFTERTQKKHHFLIVALKDVPFGHSRVYIQENLFIIYYPADNIDAGQKIIDIAHELGHVLLQFLSMNNDNALSIEVNKAVKQFIELDKDVGNRGKPKYQELYKIVESQASCLAWLILCEKSKYYKEQCKKLSPIVNYLGVLEDCHLINNSRGLGNKG